MGMSNNFLSQEEINALLSGESLDTEDNSALSSADTNLEDTITDTDKDLLGELNVYDDIYLQPKRKKCALLPSDAVEKILEVVRNGSRNK